MVEEVSVRLAENFDVTIITGRYSRSLPRRDVLKNNVKVIRVGLGFTFDKWLYPFLAPIAVGPLKPDVIHAVLETFAGLALWFCRCNAHKILTLQTTNRTFLKGMIIRYPDTVIAISEELKRIAKTYGRNDVIVIPNGIDLRAINEACSFHKKISGRMLFVGRLEKMKGVDVLLKAFERALPEIPPHAHLRIVGDGSERVSLVQLSRELELQYRVTFTGRIAGVAVFDEFAEAELFCGLSRSEALGNVFLEAQAAGCVVIATTVGGITEIVEDGKTGILVPADDIDAAKAAIVPVFKDDQLRQKLMSEAKKGKEKYDWNAIASQYAQVLGSVI